MTDHEHEVIERLEAENERLKSEIRFVAKYLAESIVTANKIKGGWGAYPGAWSYLACTIESFVGVLNRAIEHQTADDSPPTIPE